MKYLYVGVAICVLLAINSLHRRVRALEHHADTHTVVCGEQFPPLFGASHTHTCVRPARRPSRTATGRPEHKCHCGMTWTEHIRAAGDPNLRDSDR